MRCEASAAGELRVRWAPPRRAPPRLTYDVIYAPLDLGRNTRRLSRQTLAYIICVYESAPVRAISLTADERMEAQSSAGPRVLPAGSDGTVLRLRARGNYSVSVRAHFAAGRIPPPSSSPIICGTATDVADSAEAGVRRLTAVPAGADALRVVWLPPRGHVDYYQLLAHELPRYEVRVAPFQRLIYNQKNIHTNEYLINSFYTKLAKWTILIFFINSTSHATSEINDRFYFYVIHSKVRVGSQSTTKHSQKHYSDDYKES